MTEDELQERNTIINKVRNLYKLHDAKCAEIRKRTGATEDVGYATRELLMIGRFVPAMIRLGIKPRDCSG